MATATERKEKYKHAPHVAWRKVGDEAIVLDLNTSVYYSLNETAAVMWESLGQGAAVSAVAKTISGEYDVDETQVEKDMGKLIQDLRKENLLALA